MKRLGRVLLIGCALEGVLAALLYLFPPGTQKGTSLSFISWAIAGVHIPVTWITQLFIGSLSDWFRLVVFVLQALLWSALFLLLRGCWRGKKSQSA